MAPGGYPAAQAAAPVVQAYFARQIELARDEGRPSAGVVPDAPLIEAALDAAFWASLRREEGYTPKISLALLPPEPALALKFDRPLPLTPHALSRVAPAVERPGVHLGVWPDGAALQVWGTTLSIPAFCPVLEVVAPALLVVKHHRGELAGKFVNVAVLEGDEVKIVDQDASSLPDCPGLLASLVGFDSPASWRTSANVMVDLAVSMRAHGRGGLLLVVPPASDRWLQSIVRPIAYALHPAYRGLTDLAMRPPDRPGRREWQDALQGAVAMIAGLTAVDGATVITERYELLAFGAKIARRDGSAQVEQVMVTEPIEGGAAVTVHPVLLGGTRHLSAAQFVQDQKEGVALVASQDGRFTIFAWSPCEEMVHAHRVEALLL
jgi:hypothetical protein